MLEPINIKILIIHYPVVISLFYNAFRISIEYRFYKYLKKTLLEFENLEVLWLVTLQVG